MRRRRIRKARKKKRRRGRKTKTESAVICQRNKICPKLETAEMKKSLSIWEMSSMKHSLTYSL